MEKRKVLVSFVEKGHRGESSIQNGHLLALTSNGKRLVRLQPEPKSQEQSQQLTSIAKKCQLIGVLTEKNGRNGGDSATRRQIRIEPKGTSAGIALQLRLNDENAIEKGTSAGGAIKRKIPRPANAFMLFANEWRKKLAVENPRESNKDISVRLGVLWKTMSKDVKEKYFALAREVDAEHKRKYPDPRRGLNRKFDVDTPV